MPVTDIEVVRKHLNVHETDDGYLITCEPGDATRYELAIQEVDHECVNHMHDRGVCWYVTNSNLVGDHPRTMYIREGEYLEWRDVQKELGVQAEGSAYVITLILACVIDTRYDEPNTFLAKIRASIGQ